MVDIGDSGSNSDGGFLRAVTFVSHNRRDVKFTKNQSQYEVAKLVTLMFLLGTKHSLRTDLMKALPSRSVGNEGKNI